MVGHEPRIGASMVNVITETGPKRSCREGRAETARRSIKLRLRRTVAGLRHDRAGTVRYCIKVGTDEARERPGTAEREQNQTWVLKSKRF